MQLNFEIENSAHDKKYSFEMMSESLIVYQARTYVLITYTMLNVLGLLTKKKQRIFWHMLQVVVVRLYLPDRVRVKARV